MRLGILTLGRPTFDVAFAEEKLAAMLAALDATGHDLVGPRGLLFDETATRAAMDEIAASGIDRLLILQVTFTDASMTVAAADAFDMPLAIWSIPEPRLGGRLRLNAFCGLNLASHALGLRKRDFGWLHADPAGDIASDLADLLAGRRMAGRLDSVPPPERSPEGARVAMAIRGRRIGRIGEAPAGFDTCAYSAEAIEALAGVTVEALPLDDLFEAAADASPTALAETRALAEADVTGLRDVDQAELDRSLRLKSGIEALRSSGGYSAFAIRCWPETFTQYGGAVCGPAAMLGETGLPCACEADVMGALTQLILMEAAQAPVFLTDLVDMDPKDDTGVVWHCGQAPISMRDPDAPATATVHSNRKQPLLYQFPLKPGPVTFLRISQAFGRTKMVLGAGEMLRRPMAFTGTSGVVRFTRPVGEVLADIIASGLEHHMALAYGDHRATLRATAAELGLPLLEI
ncbi:L-fucose/L-arabinose isomerase family protein [Tropicimonas sp. IMCC6043]|uniref:L-fucose/L-arabinose isomerase family protein n=1 Tax=Tropicimonas sp. IMCC6043 TaxID=2510645 RepID=UPI00101D8E18|nr:hypothetical protein [Tropicimonas sp. IMCC6043]RYH08624.1 hypothetical protein EU800_15305 [Tropicimonas sp. IMCC6043]